MNSTMTCRDGVRVLMDYSEGVLPAARRKVVESHVEICTRCQGFVRSYRETPRIVREATATCMPARLERRLRRLIADLPPRRRPS